MTDEIKGAAAVAPAGAPSGTTIEVKPIGHRHLTIEEIKNGCIKVGGENADNVRICRIEEELKQGLTDMEGYDKAVTFYGSARFNEGDEYYDKARKLAYRISKELGYTIVTGGGPGIMEGGNRGAFEAGGKSVGLSIKLPHEQKDNAYITDDVPFYFFFARKVALSFSSEAFIFFPGGYGTLDEFFEIITLIQTEKLKPIPIILFGVDFWKPFEALFKSQLFEKYNTISEADLSLFTITEDEETILEIVKNAKPRTENRGD